MAAYAKVHVLPSQRPLPRAPVPLPVAIVTPTEVLYWLASKTTVTVEPMRIPQ